MDIQSNLDRVAWLESIIFFLFYLVLFLFCSLVVVIRKIPNFSFHSIIIEILNYCFMLTISEKYPYIQHPKGCDRFEGAEENARKSDRSYGPKITIFSGGTAFNSVVTVFTQNLSNRIDFILPISDNGGSTKEIVKVLGGPAIGDIRSRLIRLASEETYECRAIKSLFEHRLSSTSKEVAKQEFFKVLDGSHVLWQCRDHKGNLPT